MSMIAENGNAVNLMEQTAPSEDADTLAKRVITARNEAEREWAEGQIGPDFDMQEMGPDGVGRQLLRHYGDLILIARERMDDPMNTDVRALIMKCREVDGARVGGTWDGSPRAFNGYVAALRRLICDALLSRARASDKDLSKWFKSLARSWNALCRAYITKDGARDNQFSQVGMLMAYARAVLDEAGHEYKEPYECRHFALDDPAAMVWLGAPNGIVNLRSGVFIQDAAEAAQHFVVGHIPDDYRPELVKLALDCPCDDCGACDARRLVAHLDPELQLYVLQALAFALRGNPQRTFLLLYGPKGGGKSSLGNAITQAFGLYVGAVNEDAFTRKRGNMAGLSPSVSALAAPRRIAILAEANSAVFNAERLKTIAGADTLRWRGLHQAERDSRVTATVLMYANDLPRLDAADAALMERMVVVPYESVRAELKRENMLTAFEGGTARAVLARQTLVALIVAAGVGLDGKPARPLQVEQAIEAARQALLGDLGMWLDEAVKEAPGHNLSTQAAWQAWCNENGQAFDSKAVNGYGRRQFTKAVSGILSVRTSKKHCHKTAKLAHCWADYTLEDGVDYE